MVALKEFLDHLKSIWCHLDRSAIKEMKDKYYAEWDSSVHITKFTPNEIRERNP